MSGEAHGLTPHGVDDAPAVRFAIPRTKGNHQCRKCGFWLEGAWNRSNDDAERAELQRQMDAGLCDSCARCTSGDGCPVHPDIHQVHAPNPTGARQLDPDSIMNPRGSAKPVHARDIPRYDTVESVREALASGLMSPADALAHAQRHAAYWHDVGRELQALAPAADALHREINRLVETKNDRSDPEWRLRAAERHEQISALWSQIARLGAGPRWAVDAAYRAASLYADRAGAAREQHETYGA